MADVDTKTVGKAFRAQLEKIRMPNREINAIISNLADLGKAGLTLKEMSIVVHKIVEKPGFKTSFLANPRISLKQIGMQPPDG